MAKKRLIKQKDKSVNHSMFHVGGGKATGAKIKSWANLRGALKHSLRIAGADNVDPAHTDKNITMFDIEVPSDPEGATKALKERFDTITQGLDKTAKNGQKKVVCEDLLFTTSPYWWNRDENGNYLHDDKENKEKLAEWVKFHEEYIDKKFGKENVVYCNVQLDETTPHISCQVVPIRTDKNGKKHISHSHYFDGKVETSNGYKINKMAHAVGNYQNSIHKIFPALEPSIKPKLNNKDKNIHFPKQAEVKAKRKSVREYYGDRDELNKEAKEKKSLLKKIKEAIFKEKEKEEELDLSIQIKERRNKELDEETLTYKEANQLIKNDFALNKKINNAIKNENLELVEELQEERKKEQGRLNNFKKKNPNFQDWREDTNKKKRRNGPGF
ncbi:plasmid recombination protein [Alcanivorax sp.]|uniref:plasmid recombination protein n=1 Tax=Alcanivorax sp. TaxID=1872427 RepID=UPI003A8E9329